MSTQSRAEATLKRINELKAQYAKLTARDNAKERAIRTRKAVILGTYLMQNEPAKVTEIIAKLTREQDKKAFSIQAEKTVVNG
jgi:predicted Zn-dependent peptidase